MSKSSNSNTSNNYDSYGNEKIHSNIDINSIQKEKFNDNENYFNPGKLIKF